MQVNSKQWFLVLISGLLVTLSMCFPMWLGFCIFFALTPIISVIHTRNSSKKIFTFYIFYVALSTLWLLEAYPLTWIHIDNKVLSLLIIGMVWTMFCVVMSVPAFFLSLLFKKVHSEKIHIMAIIGASIFVLTEYMRSLLVAISIISSETLFGPHHTYYSFAYPTVSVPFAKDILSVGGVYLATFLVVLSNYVLYYVVEKKYSQQRKNFVILLCVVVMIYVLSSLTMHYIRNKEVGVTQITATVLHTYLPSATTISMTKEKTNKVLSFVSEIHSTSDILVVPENINLTVPPGIKTDKTFDILKQYQNVFGSFTANDFYTFYFLDPSTMSASYYRKQLLMPIGEYSIDWVYYFLTFVGKKDWLTEYTSAMHTAKKSVRQTIYIDEKNKHLVVGASICSENISPYIYQNEVRSGATLLINVASHAPFNNSSLLARQTLAINTARALENGRYFITSSNYGNSSIISDNGSLITETGNTDKNSYSTSTILLHSYKTPYVRFGDFIVVFSFVFLSLYFIWKKEVI